MFLKYMDKPSPALGLWPELTNSDSAVPQSTTSLPGKTPVSAFDLTNVPSGDTSCLGAWIDRCAGNSRGLHQTQHMFSLNLARHSAHQKIRCTVENRKLDSYNHTESNCSSPSSCLAGHHKSMTLTITRRLLRSQYSTMNHHSFEGKLCGEIV